MGTTLIIYDLYKWFYQGIQHLYGSHNILRFIIVNADLVHAHIKFHIGTLLAYNYTNIHNWSKLCLLKVLKKIGPFTTIGFNQMPT